MVTKEPFQEKSSTKEIIVKTKEKKKFEEMDQSFKWWLAQTDDELVTQVLSTTNYLKKIHAVRIKQASIFTRLFSGKPLYNYLANVGNLDNSQQLPIGRPTANVVYSCTDTFVSRITQARPKPTFLTDDGHYRERLMSEQLNNFLMGEFYRCKTYEKGAFASRDSCIIGDGLIKVFAKEDKVAHERTLSTELLTDYNDAYYGTPRSLLQTKLVDRGAMLAMVKGHKEEKAVLDAQGGTVDNSPLSTDTISDQFIVAEGWHLPSGDGAPDGRHCLVSSAGILLDERFTKQTFPFAKIGYNPDIIGFFSQSLAEILMPTQMEIYKMLIVASQAIELMGVPRILIDEFSQILETAFNNNIGTIIKYSKTPPIFANPTSNPPEIYEWIKWLIQNAYQMSGISGMSASSQKPAGLNSGAAMRMYDDLQTDRFAAYSKRYETFYTDIAYLTIDCARDIAKETGSYTTVYPNKDGTREVDLPKAAILRDTYVIQCFEESSLVKDPAGRQAQLSEMLAAGEITQQEFRRLSSFPDLKQSDTLANALEERILKSLDDIVEKGKSGYSRPDVFMLDPSDLATKITVQYINKYAVTDLEEEKMQLLRDFFTQIQVLKMKAPPPPPPQAPMQGAQGASPLAVTPPAPSQGPMSNVHV